MKCLYCGDETEDTFCGWGCEGEYELGMYEANQQLDEDMLNCEVSDFLERIKDGIEKSKK